MENIRPFTERKCHKCKQIKPAKCFSRHGISKWTGKYQWDYLCNECKRGQALKSIKKKKVDLINRLGGKCSICGYNRCMASLEFHHKTGIDKKNNIARIRSYIKLEKEVEKCILICSNCHREIHYSKWCNKDIDGNFTY